MGRSLDGQSLSSCGTLRILAASAESNRLRIGRFEREGGTMEKLAEEICRKFEVTQAMLRKRHRGGTASQARKALAYVAAKEFKAPLRVIAEYLGVGTTAVSPMSQSGEKIMHDTASLNS